MRAALVPLVLALAIPAVAQQQPATEYRALQKLDQRLFETGWRLAKANAEFCTDAAPSLGALLIDLETYPDPVAAAAAFEALGPVVVQAVGADSPADKARLRAGDTLIGFARARDDTPIDAVKFANIEATYPSSDPKWQRIVGLQDRFDDIVAADGEIVLEWKDSDPRFVKATTLEAVQACPSRFEVAPIGARATADGTRVVFGPKFPAFAYADDEFAAAVAHELAHNLLKHRAWLGANGRKRKNVRLTEREADRLAPWLLLNAGYEPEAMVRLLERARPKPGGNFLTGRTHRGWDERAETIAAEIEGMRAFIDAEGRADWSQHFTREIAG